MEVSNCKQYIGRIKLRDRLFKSPNLLHVEEKLTSDKLRTFVSVLEISESTLYHIFDSLLHHAIVCLVEFEVTISGLRLSCVAFCVASKRSHFCRVFS